MGHVIAMKIAQNNMGVIVIVRGLVKTVLCQPLPAHLIVVIMVYVMLRQGNVTVCRPGLDWHVVRQYNHAQIVAVDTEFANMIWVIVCVTPHFVVSIVQRHVIFVLVNAADMVDAI